MDARTVQVLRRLGVPPALGEDWGLGDWVYVDAPAAGTWWYEVTEPGNRRIGDELSEIEANARGIYRTQTKRSNAV